MFFHFPSFSLMFFHFPSFSLSLLGAQNLIFFWASISLRFSLDSSHVKKSIFGPILGVEGGGGEGGTPLGPLFLCFLFFSPRFLSFFLLFKFSFFLIFCSFLHFLIF